MTSATTLQLDWATATAILAAALPNYESRTEQDNLAAFVDSTLQRGAHGLAQAGCGVGKSFGALIPAIRWARETGTPVVVATATKALQDQYGEKDLPFLQNVLGAAGFPFRFTVLKGRSNYVCRAKLAENLGDEVVREVASVLDADAEHSGDVDHLPLQIDWRSKNLLVSTSDECPGKKNCKFGTTCFAEGAKDRAKESHVVVANHSVVVTDAQVRRSSSGNAGMLPVYGGIVVDEAHELEDYATSSLGNEFSQASLERFAGDVSSFVEDSAAAGPLANAARLLFDRLNGLLKRDERTGRLKERTHKITDADRLALEDVFVAVLDKIEDLADMLDGVDVFGDDKKTNQRKRLTKRSNNLLDRLEGVLTASSHQLVRWVEINDKDQITLKYQPLHVGEFLADNVWAIAAVEDAEGRVVTPAIPRAALLMSATLAVPDFTYIAGRLGLPDAESFDAGSPFDFATQAGLFVPGSLPDPTKEAEEWKIAAQLNMKRLVLANGGRALLLFTSTKAMREAHAALRDSFEDEDIRVLMQGDDSLKVLAETFKNDETSVLFGLKSLMTGVDFQGPTCSLVIIDKLPFAVPTDVLVKARATVIDEAVAQRRGVDVNKAAFQPDGSFNALTIPNMIMTLLQGFGRAIRTAEDRALVVILDPRLKTKTYGKKILKALPNAARIDDMPQALAFVKDMRG